MRRSVCFFHGSSDESGGSQLEEIKIEKAQNVRHTAEQNEIRQKKERTLYELESVRREMNLRLNGNEGTERASQGQALGRISNFLSGGGETLSSVFRIRGAGGTALEDLRAGSGKGSKYRRSGGI